jgi:hypothetical protein
MSDQATPPSTPPPSTPPSTPPPSTWLNDLPEDLRADPTLTQLKGSTWQEVGPTLAKSLVDNKRFVGAEKVLKPQKNWTEKEWSEFYAAAGRPEAPDKYSSPEVQLEEGVTIDDTKMAQAREHFHKLGLSDTQAKGILEYYLGITNEQVKGSRTASAAALAETETALKKEWGRNYDMNVQLARAAIAKFGDGEFNSFLEESKLSNNPKFIKALARIGQAMTEDTATGKGGQAILPSEIQAQQEIAKLKADPAFQNQRFGSDRVLQAAAQSRWEELHRMAYPNKPAA